MKQKLTILIISALITLPIFAQKKSFDSSPSSSIIPKPQEITIGKGSFTIDQNTHILYQGKSLRNSAVILQQGLKLNAANISDISDYVSKWDMPKNSIYLTAIKGLPEEAYEIEVRKDKISCNSTTLSGMYYAIQSLIQLAGDDQGSRNIECLKIKDAPRYGWRGFMLDESRHFFGKETVKQYLDIMAKMKMNRFHWHLTDEPGWRIEIKRYPDLTRVGSIGSWSDSKAESKFYTQSDIMEIVEYARVRNIMIIPEIDMPGHATAATKAYPEISGGGEGRWKGFTYNPGDEATYEFLDNVLTEIAILFPGPYLHIGADEVHFGNQSWFTDKKILKFIEDNNLKDQTGLEHYFIKRMCDIVTSKGKKMIGWDEIINTGIDADKAIIMWWRHDKPQELTNALNKGYNVIMCPRIPCYFDFVQHNSHKIGRRWGPKFNELNTVYTFPESIDTLIVNNGAQILGLQANLWTERVKDRQRMDFMLFPRLLAIAEDGWTNTENKDYIDFERRVKVFMKYLDSQGIYYFNVFDPASTPEPWGPEKEDVIAEG